MEESQPCGLSDAMSKILQCRVKTNNFILSKAKKDRDIVIEKSKCDDHEDMLDGTEDGGLITRRKQQVPCGKVDEGGKQTRIVKPKQPSTWHQESELNALATKGVVQLFNAVNQHRKLISSSIEASGNSERECDKVLSKFSTDAFMNILSRTEGDVRVVKKKRFHDVLTEKVEETKIDEWESENSD